MNLLPACDIRQSLCDAVATGMMHSENSSVVSYSNCLRAVSKREEKRVWSLKWLEVSLCFSSSS